MNSLKYFLIIFFLLFVSVNVFAEYKVKMNWVEIKTIAHPLGGPNGPSPIGVNAYYSKDNTVNPGQPYPSHEVLEGKPNITNADWIELQFELENISTNAAGEQRPVSEIRINITSWNLIAPYPYVSFIYNGAAASNPYTTATGLFSYGRKIVFSVPIEINDIVSAANYEVRSIPVHVEFENSGYWQYYLDDLSSPSTSPNVEVYDPVIPPALPSFNDIKAFLDPVTCYDSAGVRAPTVNGRIRCDQIDSNTITYEFMFEDINSNHTPVTGDYAVINSFEMVCTTVPDSGYYDGRIMHYCMGCPGGYFGGIQYVGFPASSEFLHYDNTPPNQPGHTNWTSLSGVPKFSAPPNFTSISNCPDGTYCPEQDKNIFYNTNYFRFEKFLGNSNPDLNFSLQFGQRKVFKGTVTNARTGGNWVCFAWYDYNVFNAAGTSLYFVDYKYAITGGSNLRLYDGLPSQSGRWHAPKLKLEGHDAFIVKENGEFMPSSPYVRPLVPWTVELPIANYGNNWDGLTPKDVLFVDVNITTEDWFPIGVQTLKLDGSDADHTLNTDKNKLFFVAFPILNETFYHQMLTAAAMNAKLYDFNGWIFDLSKDIPISNTRLITILNPIFYKLFGNACFTDPDLDKTCWWNYLPYILSVIDLNANTDKEFILRLRNPFDFNEFFDLSYKTNNPGNARLDFEPVTNFVPAFTSGEFGYKYAKMILRNPRILRGDANYQVIVTSVAHPYVWDDLKAQFKTVSHNLKIESFTVSPQKENYNIGEELTFTLVIKNTGGANSLNPFLEYERDINFLVVSSMDPTIRFYAPGDVDVRAGQTVTFTGTLPAIPHKGVFEIEATVASVPFEFDTSDNNEKIIIVTGYQGDISNLPETNYLGILFVLVTVLLVVVKKK